MNKRFRSIFGFRRSESGNVRAVFEELLRDIGTSHHHTDETLDALIQVLTAALNTTLEGHLTQRSERGWSTALIDAVAARVLEQISATTVR